MFRFIEVLALVVIVCALIYAVLYKAENDPYSERYIPADEVVYATYDKPVSGYLAHPPGSGPFPALLLIHDWRGLDPWIKERANDLAREGYAVLAVDLYDNVVATSTDHAQRLARDVLDNTDATAANLASAISFLQNNPIVSPEDIGVVGWGIGGTWAFVLGESEEPQVQIAVNYYGDTAPVNGSSTFRATLVMHLGEEDVEARVRDAEARAGVLESSPLRHAVFLYPNAGDAFADERAPGYREDSASLAWSRTLDLLERELVRN